MELSPRGGRQKGDAAKAWPVTSSGRMNRWLSWCRAAAVAKPWLVACLLWAGCTAPGPVSLPGVGGAVREAGMVMPRPSATAAVDAVGEPELLRRAAAAAPRPEVSASPKWEGADGADVDVVAEERAAERLLRERFAAAADPVEAALELVAFLAQRERHREALAVAQAAWQRTPAVPLRVALVGLYRDLGQRATAVAELSAWKLEYGAQQMPPSALLELAELKDLLGARDEALAVLGELRRYHEWQVLGTNLGAEVLALQAELAVGGEEPRPRLRDVLADLRGHDDVAVRRESLTALAELAELEPALTEVLAQAVAIACGDADAQLRARAVELAQPPAQAAAAWLQAALADAAPEVRRAAAGRAAHWLAAAALPWLGAALAAEADPAVFRQLWQELRGLGLELAELPPAGEDSPAVRAACVAQWRQACSR